MSVPDSFFRLPRKQHVHEFKYVLLSSDGHVEWETGENRIITVSSSGRTEVAPDDPLPHGVRHASNQLRGVVEVAAQHTCTDPAHVVAVLGETQVAQTAYTRNLCMYTHIHSY
jgi:hypothetical protein